MAELPHRLKGASSFGELVRQVQENFDALAEQIVSSGGGSGLGPNTVGASEVIDGSLGSNELAFDPFDTALLQRAVRLTAVDTAASSTDDLILCDTSGGDVRVTAPSVPPYDGFNFEVKLWTPGNSVIIDGNGTDVEGSPTNTFSNPNQSLRVTYSTAVSEWVLG